MTRRAEAAILEVIPAGEGGSMGEAMGEAMAEAAIFKAYRELPEASPQEPIRQLSPSPFGRG